MKFAVGYQLPEEDEEPLVDIVRDFRDHIHEVYFPWLDMPSGRSPMSARDGAADWQAQPRLEADLRALKDMGVRLDILFNANCYGRQSLAVSLANRVGSVVAHLLDTVGLDAVTTTSPFIARTIQEHFPQLDVRASVNMRIGTVKGMSYLADLFDSFYLQREYNRDLDRIRELKAWADAHAKGLLCLVNSGCVNFCSAQTFHDNLVAHDREVDPAGALPGFDPHVCWGLLRNRANWPVVLQSTWIRPEDLHRYEGLFEEVKLATRVHARPRAVIDAYARGRHRGNLLDLLEPNFSRALAPYILDSERFPDDWFERTSGCGRQCDRCDYCAKTLDRLLVDARDAETAPL